MLLWVDVVLFFWGAGRGAGEGKGGSKQKKGHGKV